jgi:phosphatidylethanolamine/phosphatidyl-N-methylethanolamine N-methyltransferase
MMAHARMEEATTSRCYDLWASIYDHTFGALVHRRQIRALQQLRLQPGQRVLDIGVGTGMTLPHYPKHVRVFGLDLSAGMLSKAKLKANELGLTHCRLVRADAMLPPFADGSFDQIVISHTISVVSEPAKLVKWAARLVKPTGRIIVLNHFHSTNRFIAWWEKVLNPLCVKIGWRSDLSLDECLAGSDLKIDYHFKMALWDFWQIVVLAPRRGASEASSGKPAAVTPRTQALLT